MILTLENTNTADIDKTMQRLRDESGVVTLGRVLTLVIVAEAGHSEKALDAAITASHEHPCRIIMHVAHSANDSTRLDAQVRVGGDAGASEVVVLHGYGALAEPHETLVAALLLPDAPIVVWWPHRVPSSPADSSIGEIAHRRITDSTNATDVATCLDQLAQHYRPGDTDISWTRLTMWRVQLSAAFEQAPPSPVREVVITGADDSSRIRLLGAWLGHSLQAAVRFEHPERTTHGLDKVRLVREDGDIVLDRPGDTLATLSQPGQRDQQVALPHRTLSACLAEELRRLDPDEVYGDVLHAAARFEAEAQDRQPLHGENGGPRPVHTAWNETPVAETPAAAADDEAPAEEEA